MLKLKQIDDINKVKDIKWISYDKYFGLGLATLLSILSDFIEETGLYNQLKEELEILFVNKEMYEITLLGMNMLNPTKYASVGSKYRKIYFPLP